GGARQEVGEHLLLLVEPGQKPPRVLVQVGPHEVPGLKGLVPAGAAQDDLDHLVGRDAGGQDGWENAPGRQADEQVEVAEAKAVRPSAFEAAAREDFVEREQTAGFVGTARDGAAGKNDCHLARAEGSHGGIPFLDDRDAPVADEPLLERHRKLVSASRCGRANSRYKFAILETMNEREREFEAFVGEMAALGVRPLFYP